MGRSWRRTAIVAVGAALLVVAGWAMKNALEPGANTIRRLAVLPLANYTGDPGQEYFVAGMHDALLTELSQIADLTVISRQSTLRYRESDKPLPAIARELGVEALVEGSVFLAGDSVRITVQLCDPAAGPGRAPIARLRRFLSSRPEPPRCLLRRPAPASRIGPEAGGRSGTRDR